MNTQLKTVSYIVTGVFFIYLLTLVKQCSEPKSTIPITIEVPAKSGSFEKPTEVIPGITKKDSVVYINGKIIYTENPVNKELFEEYKKANDSIEKLKLYLAAIEEKEGTYVYDNDDIKLEVYAKTRGDLLELKPNYTIKPVKVKTEVPVKETVLAVYGGLGLLNNTALNNLGVKAELGLQNKKGTIFTIGADTRSNYYIGAQVRILDIKR